MTHDFLIVGAGMAGAAAAYGLSRHGSIVVLEMEAQAGYHTTGRSAAIYLPSYGPPSVRALTQASFDFLDASPADLGLEHRLLEPRDVLYIAPNDRVGALHAFVAEARAQGMPVEMIEPEVACSRVPVLRPDYFHAAACEQGAYDLDVASLHRGMLRAARARDARIILDASVEHIARDAGGWTVVASGQTFHARHLVNAAGAWATHVARMAGASPIRLDPLRRTMISVDTGEQPFSAEWPMVEAIGESLYFKPESGRILASCGDETPWPPSDVQPDDMDVAFTVDLLERATIYDVRRVSAQWAGLRVFAADRLPVIGADPVAPDFHWMAGLGGYGIQIAPAIADLIAAQLSGQDTPAHLAARGLKSADVTPGRLL
ncbi:FAD-binding oxidoreductase [Luteimonas marina]|uniref:FAD-binding oxidoreductase n=1 Tax=Luteimonas marina TaxID=488485 RepID=A0A5C5TZA2_9GAMM|nr:FAD-binding oxidoreductase [Luteimonas marina]TWT18708.1 FAD-binding oxidoreductase [Luteimonas marina]